MQKFIISLIILGILGVGGWFLLQQGGQQLTESPEALISWKKYRSEKNSFELEVPTTWSEFRHEQIPEFYVRLDSDKDGVRVLIETLKKYTLLGGPLDDFVNKTIKNNKTDSVLSRKDAVLPNNLRAIEVLYQSPDGGYHKDTSLEYDTTIYTISIHFPKGINKDPYDEIYQHMLSTFSAI